MKIIRTALVLGMLLTAAAAYGMSVKTDYDKSYAFGGLNSVSFDTDGLRFEDQVVGEESPPLRVTATNAGARPLYVNSVEVKGENWKEFRVVKDTCTGRALAPGRSCVVDVSFAPAETGDRTAGLVVNDSTPDSPHKITLTGAGINSADVPPFGGD